MAGHTTPDAWRTASEKWLRWHDMKPNQEGGVNFLFWFPKSATKRGVIGVERKTWYFDVSDHAESRPGIRIL